MSDVSPRYAQRRFSVKRDRAGVPHIQASDWWDVLYGLGYLHAVDRGTQILFSRAVAGGRAAELIADRSDFRETDGFFRRCGLHLNLEAEIAAMDQATLDQVLVYCAGVNDGLRAMGRSLPMWASGFEPQPWDPAAVILVGRLMTFGGLVVSQLDNELLIVQLVQAGAADRTLRTLFAPRLDTVDFDLVRQVRMVNRLSDEALELVVDLPKMAGSNAWAVAPWRSRSGGALLAGDPHLEVNRLPAIWYEAAMGWDDAYVLGASLPGVPVFATARTRNLAWSVTYIKADTVDLFIEDCRKIEGGGWQYRRGDRWLDFRVRMEAIQHKGAATSQVEILENEVGTLHATPDVDGYYLNVAWVGRRITSAETFRVWLDLIHCEHVADALDLVKHCPQPTLNYVLADRQGHIGLQGCGVVPKRDNPSAGLGPLPAWDDRNHWKGWLNIDLFPSVYDPPTGFLATANEECNPARGPLIVTQTLHDYRLRRIESRLRDLPAATLEQMQQLQYDVWSVQADELLAVILPELHDGWLKQRLSAWDRRYTPESSDAPLFQQLYRFLMMELLGNDQGIGWRRMLYLCSRAGFSGMVLTAADRLLLQEESDWWQGCDRGEIIRRAASRVVDKPGLCWSDINNFHFTDRFLGSHRVGRLLGYTTRKHAMPGCHATVFQGHVFQSARREATFAPSYHFVADLASDEAWTNLPGGPSENRFSKFYRSDIPLWMDGEYKRMTAGE